MKHNLLKILSLIILMIPSLTFAAGSVTATFGVGTKAKTACSVSATPLNFGPYDGISGDVTATNTFTMVCDLTTSPTWQFDGGANFSSGRRLSNGTLYLNYELYQDTAMTMSVDVTNPINTYAGIPIIPNPAGTVYQVFGKIPGGQTVDTTGPEYTDTITVTIGF